MMKLICLGSSSKGNGYILDNGEEALAIEAGLPLSEASKAVGRKTSRIKACLISHKHGDHAKYIQEYVNAGIAIYCTDDTMKEDKVAGVHNVGFMEKGKAGGFKFMAVEMQHDVKCYGFLVKHDDMGTMLFATDTAFIRGRFPNVNHLMIEANYDEDILRKNVEAGLLTQDRADRVTLNHQSIDTCVEFIDRLDKTRLVNVVLLHLSADNSDADTFKAKAEKTAVAGIYIAKKGLEVELHPDTTF